MSSAPAFHARASLSSAVFSLLLSQFPPHSPSLAICCVQLFSGLDFGGSTVGYAGVRAMCMTTATQGINMARITSTDEQTSGTVTHEMGHNWGMSHTNSVNSDAGVPTSCYDTNNAHIMDPSGGSTPPTEWTTCSAAFLLDYVEGYGARNPGYGYWSNIPMCAENVPTEAWSGATAVCGDGVREAGEECDCGARPCSEVDPGCGDTTCMLVSGAQCSLLDLCCQAGPGGSESQTTLRSGGYVCRASTGSCDVADSCTGSSASCPPDAVETVGTACTTPAASHSGRCYGGACHSHDEQCFILDRDFYSPGTLSGNECPSNGDPHSGSCGQLSCEGGTGGCYVGLNVGDGIVQSADGVPCGSANMCMSGSCVTISSLSAPTMEPTKAPAMPTTAPTKAPTLPPVPTKAPTPPTNAPTTNSPTLGVCAGNRATWDASYGSCETYAAGQPNADYCTDAGTSSGNEGITANNACFECGVCGSEPTHAPTAAPTKNPTVATVAPSDSPTPATATPSVSPTSAPTKTPTTSIPTAAPTQSPITLTPTAVPTETPTAAPTEAPVPIPTLDPTAIPTAAPTEAPVPVPTLEPTSPTEAPTTKNPTSPTSAPSPPLIHLFCFASLL